MNIINSTIVRFSALNIWRGTIGKSSPPLPSLQQTLCRWSHLHVGKEPKVCWGGLPFAKLQGGPVYKQPTWHHQQIRTVKRGTEYQPKNIKRKRTHGWLKRISTQGGIEVILRRMLKGRKSLTH